MVRIFLLYLIPNIFSTLLNISSPDTLTSPVYITTYNGLLINNYYILFN